ncbi:MAG TPA: M36 family metallopeptidase, partial [Kofleriaceae bacterium]
HRALSVDGTGYANGTAAYGPTTYNVTNAAVVLGNDGTGASSTDGCEALPATLGGKIVVLDRGNCNFKVKTLNAQTAGAAAVIIANNADGVAPGLADDATITTPITIPTLSVSKPDGMTIKTAAAGAITGAMSRNPDPDLDGSLDITVIGHEFGHFVHHRLSACDTDLCGAMSEGWADFSALLVSSRAGDDFDAQFPLGMFSTRGIATDPVFYGIRRAPYTTNHAVNGLSFRHMQQGEPLPPAPFAPSDPQSNNEVHAAGEVWASMLWEGYAALQKAGGADAASFEATRLKMRQYVVAGLMLAPPQATPTETRDAILTAVRASSQADHDLLYAAYAKRGFGSCAVSPARTSSDFKTITESAELKGRIGVAKIGVTQPTKCDDDGALDPGEVLEMSIPITNPGPAAMTNVKASLHSGLVDAVGDSTVTVGDLAAYNGTAMATFQVKLKDSVKSPTEGDINIELSSDDGCPPITIPVTARLNTDDKPNASANDDFNSGTSAWTPTGSASVWDHERTSGLQGDQFGEDAAVASDASLVSPKLTAGKDAVTISFEHVFLFESLDGGAQDEQAFDGGVVEYATDVTDDPAAGTWHDISDLVDPGYNRTLYNTMTDNVLGGRKAYGFINDSFPDVDTVTLSLGTKLANKTFRIRFRIGTDSGNGAGPAVGWQVDNIKTKGLTNTPFTQLVADDDACHLKPDDGGCCQTGRGMATANLAAAFGVLGLVLRRRRKAARA